MKLLGCHGGVLQVLPPGLSLGGSAGVRAFATGVSGWDELAPGGAFARRAVHELLFDPTTGGPPPRFLALALARKAMGGDGDAAALGAPGALVWCDPDGTLYPPAVAAAGVPPDRLYLLRPPPAHLTWAVAECLRCRGVAAVVAVLPPRLSRAEARRLQLAAERGGGVGLLLRPRGAAGNARADVYAAATRWLVSPAGGGRTVQRWRIQLIHGHGGQVGQPILLEKHRAHATIAAVVGEPVGTSRSAARLLPEADPLRLPASLAGGPGASAAAAAARASA